MSALRLEFDMESNVPAGAKAFSVERSDLVLGEPQPPAEVPLSGLITVDGPRAGEGVFSCQIRLQSTQPSSRVVHEGELLIPLGS
jgi:hypothetical protein